MKTAQRCHMCRFLSRDICQGLRTGVRGLPKELGVLEPGQISLAGGERKAFLAW